MPIRLVSVPTDWENEIASWCVRYNEAGTTWKPTGPNSYSSSGYENLGQHPGGQSNLGTFPSNKTIRVFRVGVQIHSSEARTQYARLYDETAVTAIYSISVTDVAGYYEWHGNPLASYAYPSGNEVYAQGKISVYTPLFHIRALFLAQVVDR
jgi:hypothetical protein